MLKSRKACDEGEQATCALIGTDTLSRMPVQENCEFGNVH
jgi:hypothetical protein